EARQRGYVREHYFTETDGTARHDFAEGPVLDAGCGAGRDALYFQERYDTLAADVSPHAARERGVEGVATMDMFALPVPAGAVRTVHCHGTQAQFARSAVGLAGLLAEFARVTDDRGRATVDAHDPTHPDAEQLFGYRSDPRPGVGWRGFHFEFGDLVGETLWFRLRSPARFRAAVAATEWSVADVLGEGSRHYVVCLRK
ncbi:MAG: class I SAM-dependent methyltransferase, partial [Halobacteriaceae archaeon]